MNNNRFEVEGYTRVADAAKLINSSHQFVLNCLADGRLRGKSFQWGKRIVSMVETSSLKKRPYKSWRGGDPRPKVALTREPLITKGYRYIYVPEHARADGHGYVAEHHLVAEKMLGRSLTVEEVVHHKNRKRADNRPQNLVVYEDSGAHLRAEHSEFMSLVLQVRGNVKLERKAISALKKILV